MSKTRQVYDPTTGRWVAKPTYVWTIGGGLLVGAVTGYLLAAILIALLGPLWAAAVGIVVLASLVGLVALGS